MSRLELLIELNSSKVDGSLTGGKKLMSSMVDEVVDEVDETEDRARVDNGDRGEGRGDCDCDVLLLLVKADEGGENMSSERVDDATVAAVAGGLGYATDNDELLVTVDDDSLLVAADAAADVVAVGDFLGDLLLAPPVTAASTSNFSFMSWMKWHRGPYGQKPFEWNVLQKSVLYFGWRVISLSSLIPCAN